MTEIRACPCQHTTPCDPRCTCVTPASSSGCARCCAYGSSEQQSAKAKALARAIDESRNDAVRDSEVARAGREAERALIVAALDARADTHMRAMRKAREAKDEDGYDAAARAYSEAKDCARAITCPQ